MQSEVPSPRTDASCGGSSRIPSAPYIRRGVVPTLSAKWNSSLIPRPQTQPSNNSGFLLDELPPGVVVGILQNLARTNVKDPVRLGAVSRNCHEAFVALKESDKRFNETLKIFRGEYDHFGASSNSKTRHRYKLRRLGTIHQTRW